MPGRLAASERGWAPPRRYDLSMRRRYEQASPPKFCKREQNPGILALQARSNRKSPALERRSAIRHRPRPGTTTGPLTKGTAPHRGSDRAARGEGPRVALLRGALCIATAVSASWARVVEGVGVGRGRRGPGRRRRPARRVEGGLGTCSAEEGGDVGGRVGPRVRAAVAAEAASEKESVSRACWRNVGFAGTWWEGGAVDGGAPPPGGAGGLQRARVRRGGGGARRGPGR